MRRTHDWRQCAVSKRLYYKRVRAGWSHEKSFSAPAQEELLNPHQLKKNALAEQALINLALKNWGR